MGMPYKKVFLVILDGFGLATPSPGNAVLQADMAYLNSLISKYPSFSLMAASLIVGLPSGKFGNSEVGHSTIGTGRIITQDWARINNAIKDETFFSNPAFMSAVQHCKNNNSAMHIAGCFSDGGIHSHEDHLFALVRLMERENLKKIYLHLITDGKDTLGTASLESLTRLEAYMQSSGAKIVTVSGRKYGMDRVQNWELTKKMWDAMVCGHILNPRMHKSCSMMKLYLDMWRLTARLLLLCRTMIV
jgi:2,3-bisphosphoglycerate-independent phosphoglycerate mutase